VNLTAITAPLLYLAAAFAAGFVIGRLRSLENHTQFQTSGEASLSRVIGQRFPPPDHHLLNHLTLPIEGGTTQIDHVLVSRFGVFVIESKHYSGWILGTEKQAQWTQVFFNRTFKFQNPIRQNHLHVLAVRHLLDFLPPDVIKSIVVFTGDAEFKTDVPDGVFSLTTLLDHLGKQTTEVMSMNRMQFCVGRLETARLAVSGETDIAHVENLRKRHGVPLDP
jgi:Nuclease-related domain